eukprot:1201871-Amorphochlora_amoeboformis.AAC.1
MQLETRDVEQVGAGGVGVDGFDGIDGADEAGEPTRPDGNGDETGLCVCVGSAGGYEGETYDGEMVLWMEGQI